MWNPHCSKIRGYLALLTAMRHLGDERMLCKVNKTDIAVRLQHGSFTTTRRKRLVGWRDDEAAPTTTTSIERSVGSGILGNEN
jgi:hypothetical protein